MTKKAALNVVHIASGDLWAGAEVQLYTLARKLAESPDINVTVALLNHGKLEQELTRAGINVVVVDETTAGALMIMVQLTRIIRRSGADIIHTHRSKENILGSLAGLFAGGVPSIRTVHGAPEHKPSVKQPGKYVIAMLDYLSARFLQKAIVAVSNDLLSMLENKFPPGKLYVIRNGIDPDDFATLEKLTSGQRQCPTWQGQDRHCRQACTRQTGRPVYQNSSLHDGEPPGIISKLSYLRRWPPAPAT